MHADFALLEKSRANFLIERKGFSNLSVAGYVPFFYEPQLAVSAMRTDLLPIIEEAIYAISAAEQESMRSAWLAPARTPWYKRPPWLLVSLAVALVIGLGATLGRTALERGRRLRQRNDEFVQAERMYRALEGSIADLVTLHARDGTILYASPSARALTGYAPQELIAQGLSSLVHPDDGNCPILKGGSGLEEAAPRQGTIRVRCKSNEYRSFKYTAHAFEASGKGEYVVVSRDVTDCLALEEQLGRAQAEYRHLAFHDTHTNLPNRGAALLRLQEAISDANRSKKPFSVLLRC